ncbi:MAG: pyrimidine/purine nucleoside phosphorylase [Algisphaera sp.]
MRQPSLESFSNVTATCKANLYFDGKVISHSLTLADGAKKTLGLIFPGSFTFNTDAPETMHIIEGTCQAKVAGVTNWTTYAAGTSFDIDGNSSFEIAVDNGVAQYVCSFR